MKINVDFIYPIGSVYITTQAMNPGVLFGGKWVQTCKSRCLVGAGSNVANTDTTYGTLDAGSLNLTAGVLLGVPTVTLQNNHLPILTGTLPHIAGDEASVSGICTHISGGNSYKEGAQTGTYVTTKHQIQIGGGQAHSNMMPAEIYYIWKRVS